MASSEEDQNEIIDSEGTSLLDLTGSLGSKVRELTQKIVQTKLQRKAKIEEMKVELRLSETNNTKLKTILHERETKYAKLHSEHQNISSIKEEIIEKVKRNNEKVNQILKSMESIMGNTKLVQEDKKNITTMYEDFLKQMADVRANNAQLQNEYSKQLQTLQQRLDGKNDLINQQNERITVLKNYATYSHNCANNLQQQKEDLSATNVSLNNQIEELTAKLSNQQNNYESWQEENMKKNEEIKRNLEDVVNRYYSQVNEIVSLNTDLTRANDYASSLNENIEVLKEEKTILEKKSVELQLAYENKLVNLEIDLLKMKVEKLQEDSLSQFKTFNTYVTEMITDFDNKQKLTEKNREIEEMKKNMQELENSKQKLQMEIIDMTTKNKDTINSLTSMHLKGSQINQAREMEFKNKIKTLEDQIASITKERDELKYQTVISLNWKNQYTKLLRHNEQEKMSNLATNTNKANPAIASCSGLTRSNFVDEKLQSSHTPAKETQESHTLRRKSSFRSDSSSDSSDGFKLDIKAEKRFRGILKKK